MTQITQAQEILRELKSILKRAEYLIEMLEDDSETNIIKEDSQQFKRRYLERKITDALNELGVNIELTGYTYIKQVELIMLENPEKQYSLSSDVYLEVAKKYDLTVTSVERAIRYAVEVIFKDVGRVEGYFELKFDKKMTAKQFLITLKNKLLEN